MADGMVAGDRIGMVNSVWGGLFWRSASGSSSLSSSGGVVGVGEGVTVDGRAVLPIGVSSQSGQSCWSVCGGWKLTLFLVGRFDGGGAMVGGGSGSGGGGSVVVGLVCGVGLVGLSCLCSPVLLSAGWWGSGGCKRGTSVVRQEMGGGGGGRVVGGGGVRVGDGGGGSGGGAVGGVWGGVWGRVGCGEGELLSSMVVGRSWVSRFEVVGTGTGRRWMR